VNPLDDPRRAQSETMALQAEQAWSTGKQEDGRGLFAKAAELEEAVAFSVPETSARMRGVLAISAVALWYKAARYDHAKRVAYSFLAGGQHLTEQGRADLEDLVDRCSREGAVARVGVASDMIPVEVKLDGGRVLVGLAPASATRIVRERATQLLIRSADLLTGQDYREHGESELTRNDQIQIYEAPARAASYGVRLYVATGTQPPLAKMTGEITPQQVVEHFLGVAVAAEQGPEAVRDIVKIRQYADAFIEGFGDIAPDGEDVVRVVCSAPTWRVPNGPRPIFERAHREALRAALPGATRTPRPGEQTFEGKLVEVRLRSGEKWIGVKVEAREEPHYFMFPTDYKRLGAKAVQLYEQLVLVRAYMPPGRNRRLHLADIQSAPRQRAPAT
jgi:hypothetical protein